MSGNRKGDFNIEENSHGNRRYVFHRFFPELYSYTPIFYRQLYNARGVGELIFFNGGGPVN